MSDAAPDQEQREETIDDYQEHQCAEQGQHSITGAQDGHTAVSIRKQAGQRQSSHTGRYCQGLVGAKPET